LLGNGYRVRTLTFHPRRDTEFGAQVEVFPYNFDHPERLAESLRGATTLINTYWVRFSRGASTFQSAVRNSIALINAAKRAGIERIVHVSIANPSLDSRLGYYRGKAELELAVASCGISYAILRPTVIFGTEDILMNNIAWFLRRFPVFGIPGDGRYRVRPIFVEDMARLIFECATNRTDEVVDAVGPESYTFEELVRLVATRIGSRARLVHVPKALAYVSTRLVGWCVGDIILTWEEYAGLMADLLASQEKSAGETGLSQWLAENYDQVGRAYASEVGRHFSRYDRVL
jgi:uncharacterized protein YbjT (DUF2867 family)